MKTPGLEARRAAPPLSARERRELEAWCRRLVDGAPPSLPEYALRAIERSVPPPGAMLASGAIFGIVSVALMHALLTPSLEAVGRHPESAQTRRVAVAMLPQQLPMVVLPDDRELEADPELVAPRPRQPRRSRSSPPGMDRAAARRRIQPPAPAAQPACSKARRGAPGPAEQGPLELVTSP